MIKTENLQKIFQTEEVETWALLLIVTISVGTLWWQIRKASNIAPAVVMKSE